MREQRGFSECDLQYHNVNEAICIEYNDIKTKINITTYDVV